jgi:hypothetical protein
MVGDGNCEGTLGFFWVDRRPVCRVLAHYTREHRVTLVDGEVVNSTKDMTKKCENKFTWKSCASLRGEARPRYDTA